jgi:hypothetical protein
MEGVPRVEIKRNFLKASAHMTATMSIGEGYSVSEGLAKQLRMMRNTASALNNQTTTTYTTNATGNSFQHMFSGNNMSVKSKAKQATSSDIAPVLAVDTIRLPQ